MIRAPLGGQAYWDEWTVYSEGRFQHMQEIASQTSGDANYRPQYVFEIAKDNYEQILRRYSRGDPITELSVYFPPLLDAWEQSEALGQSVWTEQQQYTRHAWAVNLDHYIVCFWLVGLALSLNIPDDQWNRLTALVGNDGEDELLDRVIASRTPGRKIGTKLCHPKPYQRLLKGVNAPPEQQAQLLQDFVQHWYQDLNRPPKPGLSEMTAMYDRPYWYTYGNRNFEGGAYFGRWCVEAVAAVKAFGIDDSLCLGHEHYPGDLLRPDGPSTHPMRDNDSPGLPVPNVSPPEQPVRKGWLSRWLRRS
ncbi:PoNi-like cognate immunity protein [Hydrogenophaga sp.]|uniref:PoNi-like cognate immunity protein n=1 Tax=Hydrogenophaga sp. TaxID=1904254 RepID=UPI0035AE99E6